MDSISENCTLSQDSGQCLEDTIFNSVVNNIDDSGSQTSTPSPLISDEVTHFLELIINVIGLYVTSFFGVGANIINLTVYVKQGLKDSITLGLFTLSLSDLILVLMPLVTASCHAAEFLLPDSAIDFPSIHYVSSGWMRNMMYSMSCYITAFLSLERCCCIILPFKVKRLFTRGKTAFLIAIVFLFHLGCILMLPAAFELTWWPSVNESTSKNMSRIFRVVFFEVGEIIEFFNTTVMSLIVPAVTQLIVTICVVVMINGLRVSAKFRVKATSRPQAHNKIHSYIENEFSTLESVSQFSETKGPYDNYNNEQDKSTDTTATTDKGKRRNHLSSRDARLITTMVFLVCIQSACNIPFLAATFAWRTIPEMNIGMAYENTLRVAFSFVYLLGNLNASSNVFVYYHTSSTFRALLNGMCNPITLKASKK